MLKGQPHVREEEVEPRDADALAEAVRGAGQGLMGAQTVGAASSTCTAKATRSCGLSKRTVRLLPLAGVKTLLGTDLCKRSRGEVT
jgi:hypothetical protein